MHLIYQALLIHHGLLHWWRFLILFLLTNANFSLTPWFDLYAVKSPWSKDVRKDEVHPLLLPQGTDPIVLHNPTPQTLPYM
jgi:hypothetical protein